MIANHARRYAFVSALYTTIPRFPFYGTPLIRRFAPPSPHASHGEKGCAAIFCALNVFEAIAAQSFAPRVPMVRFRANDGVESEIDAGA